MVDPRLRSVYMVGVGGEFAGGAQEEGRLVWGLVSARASPARLLLRARRLRARLAGARGPARRSSSPACRRIRAGGGSGGWVSGPGGLLDFELRQG